MPRPLPFNNTELNDTELNSRTVDVIGNLDSLNPLYFPNSNLVDAINAVPSMMNKTFYVDSINGNDANDGSSSNPFKTIGKAMNSIPTNGSGTIYLLSDIDITTDYALNSPKNYIRIYGNGHNINVHSFLSNNENVFYRWTGSICNYTSFESLNINFIVDYPDYSLTSYGGRLALVYFSEVVQMSDCSVDISQGGSIIRNGELRLANVNITTNSTGYVVDGDGLYNSNQKIFLTQYNSTIDDSTHWVKTIIRDVNGVPRNVVSNIVL